MAKRIDFPNRGEFSVEVWADEFCTRIEDGTFLYIDRELMVVWFANAMMAGYDIGRYKSLKELKGVL